jgi:hypothetical protein
MPGAALYIGTQLFAAANAIVPGAAALGASTIAGISLAEIAGAAALPTGELSLRSSSPSPGQST